MNHFLIYGANGYTGREIVKHAIHSGLKPIVAGRNQKEIEDLAKKHELPFRVFSLTNHHSIVEGLKDCSVILNCAGPFIFTVKPIINACLETTTHYLDITGELNIMEDLQQLNDQFIQRNIMCMPGTGFDVVPSDCLSKWLSLELPSANELKLAIKHSGGVSRGTAMSIVEYVHKGGCVREEGKIKDVRPASKTIEFSIKGKEYMAHLMRWGDISTAFFSTGIPNIEVYFTGSKSRKRLLRFVGSISGILKLRMIKSLLRVLVNLFVKGPRESDESSSGRFIWGKVTSPDESTREGYIDVIPSYRLTVITAVYIGSRVLKGDFKPGFQTPSTAYGHHMVIDSGAAERFVKL